jgi:hypothetical protein
MRIFSNWINSIYEFTRQCNVVCFTTDCWPKKICKFFKNEAFLKVSDCQK